MTRTAPWLLRAVLVVLPLAAGPALASALDDRSRPVQVVASGGAWAAWAATLLAALVLSPVSLTIVRLLTPSAVAAAVGAVVAAEASLPSAAAAVAGPLGAVAVAFSAATGAAFVNGPAYPNERRFPLRPPGPLLLGPVQLAWAVVCGVPVALVLLLAARSWLAAAAVAVLGLPAVVVLARAVHALSRRWVVFVPAGVVLVDPVALADPVLFPSEAVERLGPAPAGSDSLDLTQRATGLALELRLREKVPMVLVKPGRMAEAGSSARMLFTPTRPGAVLAEAEARGLPVG